MCVSKVRVYDYIRSRYNYFNCGRCPACRQSLANRRARRIRSHFEDNNATCYFATLSYKNKFVPYVKRSDLYELAKNFDNPELDIDYSVPIYRDYSFRFDNHELGKEVEKSLSEPISTHEFKKKFCFFDLKGLSGLRTKIKRDQYKYDTNKISIAFNEDAKNFLKRLRENIFRDLGKRFEISYYYAPEYGPDTQRFHLHFLLWFPKGTSSWFIRSHVLKAWPYGDQERTAKYLQVARCPSNYLASYVNTDSTVSKFLTDHFKLRPSHSQNLGLSSNTFSFQNVLSAYVERKSFEYTTRYYDKTGRLVVLTLPYPRYIRDRYFPKFKYYNSLSSTCIKQIYRLPERCFETYGQPVFYSGKFCEPLYNCHIQRADFAPCHISERQSRFFIKRINNSYHTYFEPLGYTRDQFSDLCLRYNDDFNTWLYKKSQVDVPIQHAVQTFYNLDDLLSGIVHNDSVFPFITELITRVKDPKSGIEYSYIDPNNYPLEVESTKQLEDKYNDNIKHRNVNNYE